MSVDGPPATGAIPQPESPSLVGQVLDGRYRLVSKLGEGGMGEVYAAEHVHIAKRFAIKLLRPEIVSNPEAVTRFRQEARSSSSIGHRNIIAIDDFGELADGRIYMCMELLDGAALNDMITQPIGIDRLLNILIQTGHGLAAAHAKGIVHRDMKPENIFVSVGPGGEDIPKLLDFGIAKVSGNDGQNHLTRTGTIFGTPFYMAPEQALGNPVDARTDIYAVGVIMYECFGGSLPFQGDSFMGILTQHITMEPEPVAQRAARAGRQLPPGLADVITCCMQKNPAQRFQSMDDLVNVLVQIYRGVVGPGMSTYMEAFPVLPSAAHQIQSTPPPMARPRPMTGPVPIGNANMQTIAVTGPAGSAPVASASASGMYPGASTGAPPKSRVGLIIAILAVLAVGGGVAAFVVVSNGNKRPGPGSQVGSNGPERGSSGGLRPEAGLDASVAIAADAAAGSGSDVVAIGSGSSHDPHTGSNGEIGDGSAGGSNTPPAAEVVQVLLSARNAAMFQVYDENGAKLFDGPDQLAVPRGGSRSVVIKAAGFKDKPLVVDATKKKVQFALVRLPVSGGGHVSGGSGAGPVVPPLPPGPDCSFKILDPKNKACVKQYCAKHSEEDKCNLD
jgi:serine/threonine-protein kinase